MKTLVIIYILALSGISQGRIDDTLEQCIKRYGQPIDVRADKTKAEFRVDSIYIKCWFHDGVCSSVWYYVHSPVDGPRPRPTFTFPQVVKLLNLNSNNKKWSQTSNEAGYGQTREWDGVYHTADKVLRAQIDTFEVKVETVAVRDRLLELAEPKNIDKAMASFGADDSKALPNAEVK